jgi:hypothetical protein
MEIDLASIYGYSGRRAYAVEAIGQILHSDISWLADEIAQAGGSLPGSVRGSIWFPAFPTGYSPSEDFDGEIRTTYSGDAGSAVPEPITCFAAIFGGVGLLWRSKRRRAA